jgi:hypothetical protein
MNPSPYAYQPNVTQGALPVASVGIRFGAWVLESVLAVVTLGIGWFIWWLVLLGQGLTPARQILRLRVIDINSKVPVTPGQVFVRGFVVYALAFGIGSAILNVIVIGVGTLFTLVSALLMFRDSRQTLWDQITNTTIGRA